MPGTLKGCEKVGRTIQPAQVLRPYRARSLSFVAIQGWRAAHLPLAIIFDPSGV
jgi:hypothetical protein